MKFTKIHILFEETASTISIDLDTMIADNWVFKRGVGIYYKTIDRCMLKFQTSDGQIFDYMGYVPDFFPGQHYGDYVDMHFDARGKVIDWEIKEKDILDLLKIK